MHIRIRWFKSGSDHRLRLGYEGKTLHSFDELSIEDRRTLLSHLIRIHQAGTEHLDVEPRDVVLSKSKGPVVVSHDHCCEGLFCGELRNLVARRLGINLVAVMTLAKCGLTWKTARTTGAFEFRRAEPRLGVVSLDRLFIDSRSYLAR
ncbi:hypothetical protein MSAN_02361600 [Mycena sanguinolenta]|uniref:Uncharacterized protein n=1 Tax=Mycena sanguinolenta TaxID=230812 RepID=A0A8H6X5S0_9AGAR|nr:hypothetical protein MSAN_02361600 [Mycena sanguinolenta]